MATPISVLGIFLLHAFISINNAFNPLELYIGAQEGVALISAGEGNKYPLFDWHYNFFGECDTGFMWSYFNFKTSYSKILVQSKNEDGTFELELHYYLGDDLVNGVVPHTMTSRIKVTAVELGNDQMAIQCQSGKYLSISPNSYVFMEYCPEVMLEPCTQIGRFNKAFFILTKATFRCIKSVIFLSDKFNLLCIRNM